MQSITSSTYRFNKWSFIVNLTGPVFVVLFFNKETLWRHLIGRINKLDTVSMLDTRHAKHVLHMAPNLLHILCRDTESSRFSAPLFFVPRK